MSNEIMDVNQNGEILDIEKYADIERVDMTSPMSINNYQQDTLDEIDKLSSSFSPLFSQVNTNNDDLEEMVKKINIFDTFAENDKKKEALAKEREKEQKSITYALKKKVSKKFREALDKEHEELEDQIVTDVDIQRDFEDNINKLSDTISMRMGNLVSIMQMTQDYNNQLEVLIKKLERAVEIGEYDLNNYKETVVEPLLAKKELTPEEKSQLSRAKACVYAMERTLQSLKNQITTTYSKFEQDDVRSISYIETMFNLKDYRRITLVGIRSQASTIVRIKQDQKDIAIYRNMFEASNEVLVSAAQVQNENIANVMEMSKEGSLKLETMKAVEDEVKRGIDLLNRGYKDIEIDIKKKSDFYNQFKENRKVYNEQLNLIQTQREGIIGEDEREQMVREGNQLRKKLNRPNNK
jgi:hypothetical protein